MYIVQIASEVAPWAKVGGLSDVVMGLARELASLGHTVDTFVPKYDCLDVQEGDLQCFNTSIRSYFQGTWYDNSLWRGHLAPKLPVTFVQSHHPSLFFDRGCIYGCDDDINRFLYFSRAVMDVLAEQRSAPEIIHVHDWMAAAVAMLVKRGPFKRQFERTRVLLTIHNMAYQGKCQAFDLDKIGLNGVWFESPERMQDDFSHDLNLLKGGIIFSDFATTVSETYAKEVLSPEYGMGLHPTLQKQHLKFKGILNGLDYLYWNPQKDPHVTYTYEVKTYLTGKKKNKQAILAELGMKFDTTKPLAVVVTRLVQQKGVALIRHAILQAHAKGMQIVVLGSAPDPAIGWDFSALAEQFQSDPDVRVLLQQEEAFAHRLYAAADIVLVPSQFEPCGLTQLIALRYGAIPVVRKTGGLADTVVDVDYSGRPFEETNGFSFDHADVQGLDSALDRAVAMYKKTPERWKLLVKQAMACDFSWTHSAQSYCEIYDTLAHKNTI